MGSDEKTKQGPDMTVPEGSRHPVLYTLGHSTLSSEDFLELLRHYGIQCLVDVRTIPRSLHNPQFNKEKLSSFLRVRRIKYLHLKELGGLRRHVKGEEANAGWRNASFRGYADYMQTGEFAAGLAKLIQLAQAKTVAIMCSEAVPWRCHRSLIGDAMLVRGFQVIDIFSTRSAKPHTLTPMAKVEGTKITYPAPQEETAETSPKHPKDQGPLNLIPR